MIGIFKHIVYYVIWFDNFGSVNRDIGLVKCNMQKSFGFSYLVSQTS